MKLAYTSPLARFRMRYAELVTEAHRFAVLSAPLPQGRPYSLEGSAHTEKQAEFMAGRLKAENHARLYTVIPSKLLDTLLAERNVRL